jgi:hypothetical protein
MTITQSQQQIFVKQTRNLLSGKRNATRRLGAQCIVTLLGYYGEAFPSQTYLGKKANVVRETANRSLKTLHGSILVIRNRGYKKTCQYWLTSEFLNNRHHFYDLIPALRTISLLLLFSITSNVYSQNVTQYKELTGASRRTASAAPAVATSRWQIAVVKNKKTAFYDCPSADGPYSLFIYEQASNHILNQCNSLKGESYGTDNSNAACCCF